MEMNSTTQACVQSIFRVQTNSKKDHIYIEMANLK